MNDIIDNKGNLISYNHLVSRFGNHISYFEYLRIKHAIPCKWRNLLKQTPTQNIKPKEEDVFLTLGTESKPINLFNSKKLYWAMQDKQNVTPTCKDSWFNKYYIEFTEHKWKYIFTLAKNITIDTRLIEFQYKIIHRTYASNSLVSNFDTTVSKTCPQCNVEDNLIHTFVDCSRVKQFWIHFKDFIIKTLAKPFTLKTSEVIFGKFGISHRSSNFCLLHAKWFIHLNRSQQIISFENFRSYLKNVFTIEKQIYVNKNKQQEFGKLYASFVKELES